MTWYYVNNGEAAGPISDDELLSRLRLGSFLPTTLVWRSGMTEWRAASQVAPEIQLRPAAMFEAALAPARSSDINAAPELTSGTPPVLPHFFCTSCGAIIPADQLVRIGGRNVCAACKPTYVQQVSEGISTPVKAPVLGTPAPFAAEPGSDLADPGLRLVGYILDLVFIGVPLMIAYVLLGVGFGAAAYAGMKNGAAGGAFITGFLLFLSLAFVWVFFYWTFFIGKRGATPGMKIIKLKMVRADRTPVTYSQALGRAVLLYVINACTMGLTNITAFFDREKRTVVDMICGTRVVRNEN